MSLSVVILTKNAEKDIEKSITSVSWADEVFVVDDESEDKTREIAKRLGAKVFIHALNRDFAKQRNVALEQAKGDWVLFVDSDEVVPSSLRDEIIQYTNNPINKYQGAFIKRRDYLWGREIKHGENGNTLLLRLAKKSAGKWEGKVHEIWKIDGPTVRLNGVLHHYPHQSLAEFLMEINFYTSIRAKELHEKGVRVHWWDIIVYPKAKFLQNYIVKKGFLDGTIGMILALLMSLHSFLVRAKLWQLQNTK